MLPPSCHRKPTAALMPVATGVAQHRMKIKTTAVDAFAIPIAMQRKSEDCAVNKTWQIVPIIVTCSAVNTYWFLDG